MWINRNIKQASAAGLSSDSRRRGISIALTRWCFARGRKRCLHAIAAFTAVDVTDQNTSILINRHIEKVEEIAANIGATFGPDTTALHRCLRSRIGCGPMHAAIECIGNVKMPDTNEAALQGIARGGCSIKGDRRASGTAGYCRWISNIVKAINIGDASKILPRYALIVRSKNGGLGVIIGNDKIDTTVCIGGHGRVLETR